MHFSELLINENCHVFFSNRHLIYAPSTHDTYAGATFPGLVDLMYGIEEAEDADERWNEVKKHFAALIFVIESATSVLSPVDAVY